jgi:hypothetical protein
MGQPNNGAPLPPESDARFFAILSPKGATRLRTTLLARTFTGFWTHWEDRDYACTAPDLCRRCREGIRPRWVGFIAAWEWNQNRRIVLRLTEGAARQIQAIADERGDPRGLTIDSRRLYPNKNNSRIIVEFVRREDSAQIPDEFPILPSINRLLDLNDRWYEQFGFEEFKRKYVASELERQIKEAAGGEDTKDWADRRRRMVRRIIDEATGEV